MVSVVLAGIARRIGAALFVLFVSCGLALAQGQPQPTPNAKPANIDRNGVLMLIRSSLLALDQANKTGNYTVLRDLAAPGFSAVNTAARLGEIFATQRNDKLDLSGVAVIDPQLSVLPEIAPNGMMRMAGFFPSVPSQVNFELLFAPVDGQWRLYGISVNVANAAPVAPAPPPSATKNQPAPKKPPEPKPAASPPPAAK
ncbi:hypothetical protein QRQ56_04840 [Bradyrhizobium sp. U531]|uniref:hypothetical protein n=1 Tax=Bradyrhizobium sp. U531 TaxID=3053458 RepID=UPI003F425EDF